LQIALKQGRSHFEGWKRCLDERDGLKAELQALRERLHWLSNEVMLCDYGDNNEGPVGWQLHRYDGAKKTIIGQSIEQAIDTALTRKEA